MDAELRVYFHQKMHMVWHNLQGDDFRFEAQAGFSDDVPQPELDFIHQHGAPVLWAPDDVVLAGVDNIAVRFVLSYVHS
jgi:hypothetical protein